MGILRLFKLVNKTRQMIKNEVNLNPVVSGNRIREWGMNERSGVGIGFKPRDVRPIAPRMGFFGVLVNLLAPASV